MPIGPKDLLCAGRKLGIFSRAPGTNLLVCRGRAQRLGKLTAAQTLQSRDLLSYSSSGDRNALHLALRLRPLGRGDRQNAVVERRTHLFGIDIGAELQ